MKETKNHLQKALSSMSESSALKEVRYYILKAIQELEHVSKEEKPKEKASKAQTWQDMIMNGVKNPNTSKRTLDIINNMIETSKHKLEEFQKKKNLDNSGEEETLYN